MIKYILVLSAYIFLPLLKLDTGYYILLLLLMLPSICFVTALFSAMKFGFEWLFPFLCGLLFLPFIFIYYNETAYIYCVLYSICAFGGSLLGGLLKGVFMQKRTSL